MKNLVCIILFFIPLLSHAVDGSVNSGIVTDVRAYEQTDSTLAFIGINDKSRVGPNPLVPSKECELWTYSRDILSLALTARTTGQKVNIKYVARGDNDEACVVRYFSLRDY